MSVLPQTTFVTFKLLVSPLYALCVNGNNNSTDPSGCYENQKKIQYKQCLTRHGTPSATSPLPNHRDKGSFLEIKLGNARARPITF